MLPALPLRCRSRRWNMDKHLIVLLIAGELKMTDMKMTDQMSRHENDGPSKCPGMKLTDMKMTDMKMQDMFQVCE